MSSPIKTNTEELQNILQQVYNLPDRSSGSAEPDLVIGMNTSGNMSITGEVDKLTFDSASVVNTYNKILSGQAVSCVLNAKYHIHSGGAIDASSPHITAMAWSDDNNSARVGTMRVFFNLWYSYGFGGTILVDIVFNIHHDGTASVEYLEATKSVAWSSGIV